MKILAAVFVITCCWCRVSAQQHYFFSTSSSQAYQISGFEKSMDGYRTMYKIPGERMKKWGTTMTVIGGGLIIGGIVVASSSDPNYYVYNNYTGAYDTTDPKLTLGVIMMIYGVGLTVPGIILWTRGAKKYNDYFEQQRQLSLCYSTGGVGLRYQF